MYRIGELANVANVSKRTIDYYTQLGLLTYERTESNYRFYSEEALQRLKLIELYKKEKLSLEEIRARLQVFDEQKVSATDVSHKMHEIFEQLHLVEDRLLELKPLLSKLNEQQLKVLTKTMSLQCATLIHTLSILLGDNPFK
ncbi:MerR family transcriptional regulator [Effusibacillus dendaii]|uniref:MerR family transcriptional regulator n=1 Tax=Effusibacillus dendaii TaxID=2743772 RepID=UPI001CF7D7DA|nr:MerR family transcriptional regulator [Effusibacillus dendaii]